MDSNNQRPTQQEPALDNVAGAGDWRSRFQPDSRERIVNKIMETLKRHLPVSGQDGLQELKKIAIRFEEKIYSAAISQTDYLRKISLKMLTMESKSPNTMPTALPSNSAGVSRDPQHSAPKHMQSHVQNQVQSCTMPMASSQPQVQGRQQLLAQNIPNVGVQNSSSLSTTLAPVRGLTQDFMPNVTNNSNIQNFSGSLQNNVGNSTGKGSASTMYMNVERQMQERKFEPPIGAEQQPQQSQDRQRYIYRKQLQQQKVKQELHPGNMQESSLQPQQHNIPPCQSQSSQQSIVQASTVMQPSMVSGLQQKPQTSIQQQSLSIYQQHQQSLSMEQQEAQQEKIGQQPNATNLQQSQLMGQKKWLDKHSSLSNPPLQQHNNHHDLQQQRLIGQEQQLDRHSHVGGHQKQQQQFSGAHSGKSNVQTNQPPTHIIQPSKVAEHQPTHSSSGLVPGAGQQPHQLMSQIQPQPAQLQQRWGLQQQQNIVQQNSQQCLNASNSFNQQQNMVDQRTQMIQSQGGLKEAPSTSLDSTAQTSGTDDCQEEVYQKIKAMKDTYLADLNEVYLKVTMKLQQVDSHPPQQKVDYIDKLRLFKQSLERTIHFLQLTKNNNLSIHKDKLASIEKQIVGFIASNRSRRAVSSLQQGQLPPSHQPMQQMQQPQSQISQAKLLEAGLSSQVRPSSSQGLGATQQSNTTGLGQGSVSALSAITSSPQDIVTSLQPAASLDPGKGNPMGSMHAAMGSLQQNPASASQQASINSLPPQSGNSLIPNISSLQPKSNMLQSQHFKQHEQHKMQTQHVNQQFQQCHPQQQLLPRQDLLQQHQQQHQHQLPQMKQQQLQQSGQVPSSQNSQLHQMNEVSDITLRPEMSLQPGVFQQNLSRGRRYSHQQLKPGPSFSIPSPQLLSSVSPQTIQHSSPQIDQKSLLPPIAKVGTALQATNSSYTDASPSAPMAPSPVPGDPEKVNPSGAPHTSAANIDDRQTSAVPTAASSHAIATPGISASPLLAEFTAPDGNNSNTLDIAYGKSDTIDQPIEHLLKAMESISPKALDAAVSDIESVINMMDRLAGSAPGNGSRAAVGEDLVAMTKSHLQSRTQCGINGTKRKRRCTSAMPLNMFSSAGSMNGNCTPSTGPKTAELKSTTTLNVKRSMAEASPALLEEIREINERLIDTVVDVSGEDVDRIVTSTAWKGSEGTILKCSYVAVALSPHFQAHYAAEQSQIPPLRLFVPANYPNCSPILLDMFPVEMSNEAKDLSTMAKSRFTISLCGLSQPMSIKDIARTWDACTRAVMCEYARQHGGGTFSLRCGGWEDVSGWEDVLTAA